MGAVDAVSKPMELEGDRCRLAEKRGRRFRRGKPEVAGKQQQALALCQRTFGDIQESFVVFAAQPLCTFRDIGGHRYRCTPQLRDDSELFRPRKSRCQPIGR